MENAYNMKQFTIIYNEFESKQFLMMQFLNVNVHREYRQRERGREGGRIRQKIKIIRQNILVLYLIHAITYYEHERASS